ncbi:hypothetical protein FGO68_gene600 [Halteria grandinella]|uniref:Uncharacterized protein n=1 Tax=Halteria grandinella TaxID=5974 RepID=A0A8J8SZJ1_HALGN|nr:hypothetical protein FGO68_gene600 [Halteria grandinella]
MISLSGIIISPSFESSLPLISTSSITQLKLSNFMLYPSNKISSTQLSNSIYALAFGGTTRSFPISLHSALCCAFGLILTAGQLFQLFTKKTLMLPRQVQSRHLQLKYCFRAPVQVLKQYSLYS